MERINLEATPRTIFGKKVKKMRRSGHVPANIYGKGLDSTAVSVVEKTFRDVLRSAGETSLVYIDVTGEDSPRPVLVQSVQKHPVSNSLIHVNFYQVNLKEKTTAKVPVVLIGENELEKRGEGLILQTLNEIEIEALPTDIPHEFEIDITSLTEIGQGVKVGDLSYDREKVEIKSDHEENVLIMQEAEMPEEVVVEATAETIEPEVIGEVKEGEEEVAPGEEVKAKEEESKG